jgi:hypothetical protein
MLEPRVGVYSRDKTRLGLMNGIKPFVVEVAAIQQIERPSLDDKIVQHVDFGRLVIRGVYKVLDCAPQTQQGMQFDRTFVATKRWPRIHRQAQIDRCCIEGVDRSILIDPQ